MKIISFILFLIGMYSMAAMAVVPKNSAPDSQDYGNEICQLIIQKRAVFLGHVFATTRGIAITTNRGTFLLKGLGLKSLVGKNVRVTGEVRQGTLFAVKIDVKI